MIEALALGIPLVGILIQLLVNGARAERLRRRELHARALAAVMDYGEMPFMIRRRQSGADHEGAERVRLSSHFSQTKSEIETCRILLAADGHKSVSAAYERLVYTARETVGREAHQAWKEPPVESDPQMNMGDLYDRLSRFRKELDAFSDTLKSATLPWWHRQRVIGSKRAG